MSEGCSHCGATHNLKKGDWVKHKVSGTIIKIRMIKVWKEDEPEDKESFMEDDEYNVLCCFDGWGLKRPVGEFEILDDDMQYLLNGEKY